MKRYNNARARAQAKNISFTQFREQIIKTFKASQRTIFGGII